MTKTFASAAVAACIFHSSVQKRQSFTDKASSAMKPDSQKSMTEQVGDSVKGTADSLASTMQPQSEKSTSQQVGDSLSSNSNENQGSMMDKAKDMLGMSK